MTKQIDFINDTLLSVGERPFMGGVLSNTPQQRAYKIFKDSFTSFIHECGWSFLRKVGVPISWSGNVALVPQYNSVEAVFLGTRRLVSAFEVEALTYDPTIEGTVNLYLLKDNRHISFYALPSTGDKAKITIVYTSELNLPAYDANATIPLTDDFIQILQHLMSAKLCLQMLDDLESHNAFMREYAVRLMKAIQKDQRISRSRPNMFRGGR